MLVYFLNLAADTLMSADFQDEINTLDCLNNEEDEDDEGGSRSVFFLFYNN